MKEHPIVEVKKDSIAEELGIEAGDRLLRVNGQEIEDVFDIWAGTTLALKTATALSLKESKMILTFILFILM